MNTIDSYQFGCITISGREYTSDVVVFPDRVKLDWWRKIGHRIYPEDIAEVMAENPEVLVVGTGMWGMTKLLPETKEVLQAQGIRLIVEETEKACHTYNRLWHSQKVVAALHLTC